MKNPGSNNHPAQVNRRQFLKLLGLTGASILINGCQPENLVSPTPTLLPTSEKSSTAIPSPNPLPTQTTTPIVPTSIPTPIPKAMVATAKVVSYDPNNLRKELERMLDSSADLANLIKPGSRVGVKVNLTGGTWWDSPSKPPSTELFVTHPVLTGVLCELLKDAGASKITIIDGIGDDRNFEKWGYNAMARPLGVDLVNLCKPDPFPDYARIPVGPGARVYDFFYVNGILNELDVLVSIGKMKCHSTTGVTLTLKNLIGLPPISKYRLNENDNNKSAFHGNIIFDTRLPRVIIDLNQAKPIQLAVVDGIYTGEGGAGPWDKGLSQVKPGVLVAGRDPVAVDALTAMIMGFNPDAPSGTFPFTGGENHIMLARLAGLGTNLSAEIGVSGPSVEELLYKFKTVS
jgi:uncharacterized protein (DUF362 family)